MMATRSSFRSWVIWLAGILATATILAVSVVAWNVGVVSGGFARAGARMPWWGSPVGASVSTYGPLASFDQPVVASTSLADLEQNIPACRQGTKGGCWPLPGDHAVLYVAFKVAVAGDGLGPYQEVVTTLRGGDLFVHLVGWGDPIPSGRARDAGPLASYRLLTIPLEALPHGWLSIEYVRESGTDRARVYVR